MPSSAPISLVPDLASPRAQQAFLGLHSALEFRDLWAAAQNLFETTVPHDTLVMSVNYFDWRTEMPNRRLTSRNSRLSHTDELNQLVAQEGQSFFQPFLDRNQGVPCYQHSQLVHDPASIERTRYYKRYMKPSGWRYSAHLLFWSGKGGVDTSFALRRRADQGDFSPAEMQMLQAIHPHLRVAFERMRTFEQERQRRRLLESFYRAKPEAVLFVDWNLELIYASQDALALCAVWNLGERRARSFSPQAVFALPTEIAAACEALKSQWPGAAVADSGNSSTPQGNAPLRAVREPKSGYEALIGLRRENNGTLTKPIFVIRLRAGDETAIAAGSEPAGLTQERLLHRLTPTERELVTLVCAGLTNKEIAARLAKTEGSVKVQLSGIYAKLQVHSRTQLIVALR